MRILKKKYRVVFKDIKNIFYDLKAKNEKEAENVARNKYVEDNCVEVKKIVKI